MDANQQTGEDVDPDLDARKALFDKTVKLLTDPQPPLSVSDLAQLAEFHLCNGAAVLNHMVKEASSDPNLIATGLALASTDINLARGFTELAVLKRQSWTPHTPPWPMTAFTPEEHR
jgi:hypothetical protein